MSTSYKLHFYIINDDDVEDIDDDDNDDVSLISGIV
jgi:hypothetical protein